MSEEPDAKRADVLARLRDGKERDKQVKTKFLLKVLGEYCHLGRHDKGSPVRIGHRDGELAVVSATMLLRYLAEP
jgi:hypothetical protein